MVVTLVSSFSPLGPTEKPSTNSASSDRSRAVVAVIEEAASAQRCLIVAERAAKLAPSLSLSALHICVDPAKLIAAAEEMDLQQMRELYEGAARERLARARRVFEDWVGVSGMRVSWIERVGEITSSLSAEVKDVALIVIAQPHNLDSADALHAAIFDTGSPVLYVPTRGPLRETLCDHMVVAWKPRTQARKAVMRTLPWLRAAKRVTIVSIDEPPATQNCQEVLQLLAEHGVLADVSKVRAHHGQHVAIRLLSEAEALGADCLVMGAFRFGQIWEWAFGGVTHEVLSQTRLPVFIAH